MNEFLNPEQPPQKSWFGRNWPWLIPVGCFGMLIFVGIIVGLLLMVGMSVLKDAEPYQTAVKAAETHPIVIEHIGTPVKISYMVIGEVNITNDTGKARIAFPVSGPKGKGTIYIEAERADGKWTTKQLLFVKPDDKTKFDLLENKQIEKTPEPDGAAEPEKVTT